MLSNLIPEMTFEDLDPETRGWMLREFDAEEASGMPYRAAHLSDLGLQVVPDLIRGELSEGDTLSLARALDRRELWQASYLATRNGNVFPVRVNPSNEAARLAITEFNTW